MSKDASLKLCHQAMVVMDVHDDNSRIVLPLL